MRHLFLLFLCYTQLEVRLFFYLHLSFLQLEVHLFFYLHLSFLQFEGLLLVDLFPSSHLFLFHLRVVEALGN